MEDAAGNRKNSIDTRIKMSNKQDTILTAKSESCCLIAVFVHFNNTISSPNKR